MQYNQAIFDKVALAVEQTVSVERAALTPASRLHDDLRLGKFGRIRLALYLEEIFEVEVPDEDVGRFHTVHDIVRYIERLHREPAISVHYFSTAGHA